MDWTQALTIIVSVFGLFLVAVPYLISRMDNKFEHLLNKMDANKKDLENKIDANQKENNSRFDAMNTRFNSLENRQTAMEVEIKNINQRLSNIENCVMPRKVYRFEEHHRDDEEPKEN